MQPGSLMSSGLMSDTQKLSRPSLRGTLPRVLQGRQAAQAASVCQALCQPHSLNRTNVSLQGHSADAEDGHGRLAPGTEQTPGICLSR